MATGRELVAARLGYPTSSRPSVSDWACSAPPLRIASELFADDDTRLVAQVRPDNHVSPRPLWEIAVAALAGHADLTYLLVGWLLQLGSLLVPAESRDVLIPITVS
jgi:hypothetical protein